MKWLNGNRMNLMLVGIVAAVVLGSGSANADFTFGEPTNLGAPINSSAWDLNPRMTSDCLELYFVTERASGFGNDEIWVTKRDTTSDPWHEPGSVDLPTANTGWYWAPDISADGLSLFLTSDERPDERYGGSDIYISTRATKSDPWSQPANLGPVINTSLSEACPCISDDELTLFFSGDPWNSSSDIWAASRLTKEDGWSQPQNLGAPVNSSSIDAGPFITADGRVLFFESNRPGGLGDTDIYMSTRVTRDSPWGEPINLGPSVNSPNMDGTAEISLDGSTLLFTSTRPGSQGSMDIWQAPIIPNVDLNSDGIVDAADMVIMVDNWGTDNSLCDIGPMPWGDGIVDVQDLIVLAEHLFEEYPPPEAVE